jgi:hypothetical protein
MTADEAFREVLQFIQERKSQFTTQPRTESEQVTAAEFLTASILSRGFSGLASFSPVLDKDLVAELEAHLVSFWLQFKKARHIT